METSGTDNTYLYGYCYGRGEINSMKVRVDDKAVTFASSLSDGTEVEVVVEIVIF